MPDLILNGDYKPILGLRETERGIKFIKDFFQDHLAATLNLQRVSAPLFLKKGSGINDDLNGVEAKASFHIKDDGHCEAECLFSLAKWKRMVLADYGFAHGEGLYTDMNAIRPDEECLDNLHSVYVDQWDWERIISEQERNLEFLKAIGGDYAKAADRGGGAATISKSRRSRCRNYFVHAEGCWIAGRRASAGESNHERAGAIRDRHWRRTATDLSRWSRRTMTMGHAHRQRL
jgi:hypothetical protein